MRLWSLHPQHLDRAALIAGWREALLAQAVLRGLTKGYTRHPQLSRFRDVEDPVAAIGAFLNGLADEADGRGYRFDRDRIASTAGSAPIAVTTGQLAFEAEHLRAKLATRAPDDLVRLGGKVVAHPLFRVVSGGIEPWERAHEG